MTLNFDVECPDCGQPLKICGHTPDDDGRTYNNAYKYLRENHSIDAASRILEDAMSHEGLTRKDDYGNGITYTDGFFHTEAAS